MPGELVTRQMLRRALLLNAAGKPLAIGIAVAVFAAGLLLGTIWLFPIALVFYVLLAATAFFDGDEAERVGQRTYERVRGLGASARALPAGLSPELVELLGRARVEEARIRETIAHSGLPFPEVSVEVDALAGEMERIAARAQVVAEFLRGHDPAGLRLRLGELRRTAQQQDTAAAQVRERAAAAVQDQLQLGELLESELDRFSAEMEHLIASLGVVHAHLVRISVSSDPSLQDDVAREVRDLRKRVGSVADGLRDAAEKAGDAPP
jgi:hypothetical protein